MHASQLYARQLFQREAVITNYTVNSVSRDTKGFCLRLGGYVYIRRRMLYER